MSESLQQKGYFCYPIHIVVFLIQFVEVLFLHQMRGQIL